MEGQAREHETIERWAVLEWVLVDIKVWRGSLLLHSPWNLSCFPYLRMQLLCTVQQCNLLRNSVHCGICALSHCEHGSGAEYESERMWGLPSLN